MTMSNRFVRIGLAAGVAVGLTGVARAEASGVSTAVQTASTQSASPTMSSADVQRLQDAVYDLGGDIARLRGRDASLANRLDDQLTDLRDEVIYLKVKLRKESNVSRSEYSDLRDRLDSLRAQARGETSSSSSSSSSASTSATTGAGVAATGPATAATTSGSRSAGSTGTSTSSSTRASNPDVEAPSPSSSSSSSSASTRGARGGREIPVGQEIDVRLQSTITSNTAQVEDRFEATTLVDMLEGEHVLVPAGSVMRGVVQAVNKAGRVDRKGSLTLSFDEITTKGRTYPIRATVTQAIESEGVKGEVGKIGAGAGVGAIIGGILGGFKGALAGILIGGGGTIAATEGKDVTLDSGTVLRVRFDSPVALDNSTPRR